MNRKERQEREVYDGFLAIFAHFAVKKGHCRHQYVNKTWSASCGRSSSKR
jgi:hypothetical protein